MLENLALVIFSYLLGSVPTGLWLVKLLKGVDIRQIGSGSTGTTNVLRAAGPAAATFVFFFDIAKGYVPVWLSIMLGESLIARLDPADSTTNILLYRNIFPVLCGAAALVGHSRSIFANFKGGKSAATGLGTLSAMNGLAGLSMFSVFVITLIIGRIVSISSISAAISGPIFMYLFSGNIAFSVYNLVGSLYVIYRHKDNIKRILAGTEPRIGQKIKTQN